MSGGSAKTKFTSNTKRLDGVCDSYIVDQIDKAETTLCTERVHIRHLKREIGEEKTFDVIDLSVLQMYVNRRAKKVNGDTIRKELVTFRQIWDWAKARKYVTRECPIYNDGRKWAVKTPKSEDREKFQTWEQIELHGDLGLWKLCEATAFSAWSMVGS
jgi:site-specific recombinase XerD